MSKNTLGINDLLPDTLIQITRNTTVFYCIVRKNKLCRDLFDFPALSPILNRGPVHHVIYQLVLEIVYPCIEPGTISRYPSHGMFIKEDGSFFDFYVHEKEGNVLCSALDSACTFQCSVSSDDDVTNLFNTEMENNLEKEKNLYNSVMSSLIEKNKLQLNSFAQKRKTSM